MAKLTGEQLNTVTQWADEGATLNDIQRKLKEQFGIVITYLDARLLMMDVGVRLKDKPREPEPVQETPAMPAPLEEQGAGEDFNTEDAEGQPPVSGGKVSVTVDALTLPGTVISGKASFSDGKNLSWYIDQMGRLGMKAPEPGYQPPPGDIADFQKQLDQVLMEQGF